MRAVASHRGRLVVKVYNPDPTTYYPKNPAVIDALIKPGTQVTYRGGFEYEFELDDELLPLLRLEEVAYVVNHEKALERLKNGTAPQIALAASLGIPLEKLQHARYELTVPVWDDSAKLDISFWPPYFSTYHFHKYTQLHSHTALSPTAKNWGAETLARLCKGELPEIAKTVVCAVSLLPKDDSSKTLRYLFKTGDGQAAKRKICEGVLKNLDADCKKYIDKTLAPRLFEEMGMLDALYAAALTAI